ncbi:MAG: hypothetical protein H7834_05765 [Magnetococcus sp. YQC-9]
MFRILGFSCMTIVALGVIGNARAAASAATPPAGYDPKVACDRYAVEDGIQAEHKEAYLRQCLNDLTHDRMHAEEESDPTPTDEETEALLNPPPTIKPPAAATKPAASAPPGAAKPAASAPPGAAKPAAGAKSPEPPQPKWP